MFRKLKRFTETRVHIRLCEKKKKSCLDYCAIAQLSNTASPSTVATFRCWSRFRNVPLFKSNTRPNDQSRFFRDAGSFDHCHKNYL